MRSPLKGYEEPGSHGQTRTGKDFMDLQDDTKSKILLSLFVRTVLDRPCSDFSTQQPLAISTPPK
jgi:hypothetical protein